MFKLITKIAITRFGVQRFAAEVNAAFNEGWEVWSNEHLSIQKKGLRVVCHALLWKKQEDGGCG